jgi:DNA-binding transcriptional MerR regulator
VGVNADTLSSHEVCRLTGVTYRQLDYWVRTGLVQPHEQAHGSGSRRRWTDVDIERVRRLRVAARLVSGSITDALDALDQLVPV